MSRSTRRRRAWPHWAVASACLVVLMGPVWGASEVTGLTIDSTSTLSWSVDPAADDYNVYRGDVADLIAGTPPACYGDEIVATNFGAPEDPLAGSAFLFLVTSEDAGGEGTPGNESGGTPREVAGLCDEVVELHILNRITYGPDEWSLDRLATLGTQAFIDEQLAPLTIDESGNTALLSRRDPIDPPVIINELQSHDVINATWANRQLEQILTEYWTNFMNTDYGVVHGYFNNRCNGIYTEDFQRELTITAMFTEEQQFRLKSMGNDPLLENSFRDLIEASALGPPMIRYLDTYINTAGNPNENYGRELVELYTMGVDCGYTQFDIEELSRVFTGWNICKKYAGSIGHLDACMTSADECNLAIPGDYYTNFRINQHDSGSKTLFAGTAYETVIPDTSATPADGISDVQIALDAIVDHPCTPQFMAHRMVEKFITDSPTPDLTTPVENDFINSGGDLLSLVTTTVNLPAMRDPKNIGNKIKTPLEHIASGMRATRGLWDGVNGTIRGYLIRSQHSLHRNGVPTGFPEVGQEWIDTSNMLERQNYGINLTNGTSAVFGTDLAGLMADNGLTAASPAADIVDFWNQRLFGGAMTEADVQAAITFVTTNDSGAPASVSDARIRDLVGFLLGFPQYFEQ